MLGHDFWIRDAALCDIPPAPALDRAPIAARLARGRLDDRVDLCRQRTDPEEPADMGRSAPCHADGVTPDRHGLCPDPALSEDVGFGMLRSPRPLQSSGSGRRMVAAAEVQPW
jgi:hypothetical protein